ncbi:hypothetical protein [Paraglaciecola marina]|uniref:hypothetical protein n=1 Tax=Paraglaciecola marina TaxID=2500157 RepID=UPI001061C7B5|nr:hypothetical protein [Paraglaciecola marina]
MNFKKTTILLFAQLIMSVSAYANQACTENDQLKAEYNISVEQKGRTSTSTPLILWRDKEVVAHQYPSTKITEMWQNINHKLIKPIRYFNDYHRAIEYQPGEVVHGKKETDWSYRFQLVSTSMLSKMTETKRQGAGCDERVFLTYKTDKSELSIVWIPQMKLVESFRLDNPSRKEHWQLTSLDTKTAKVDEYFKKLYAYKGTDYADIGDDHTDPFLTKMVTLGFVESGASGFYNDKGEALEGHHHH